MYYVFVILWVIFYIPTYVHIILCIILNIITNYIHISKTKKSGTIFLRVYERTLINIGQKIGKVNIKLKS